MQGSFCAFRRTFVSYWTKSFPLLLTPPHPFRRRIWRNPNDGPWRTLGEKVSSETSVDNVNQTFGLDCDGTIGFETFLQITAFRITEGADMSEPGLLEAFEVFDRNGSVYISTADLTEVPGSLGESFHSQSQPESAQKYSRSGLMVCISSWILFRGDIVCGGVEGISSRSRSSLRW
jgi:hypothetical protein